MKQIKYFVLFAVFAGVRFMGVISDATAVSSGALSQIQNEGNEKDDSKGDHAGTQGEEKEESCH